MFRLIVFLLHTWRKLGLLIFNTCGRSSKIRGLMHLMPLYDFSIVVIDLVVFLVYFSCIWLFCVKGQGPYFKTSCCTRISIWCMCDDGIWLYYFALWKWSLNIYHKNSALFRVHYEVKIMLRDCIRPHWGRVRQ